jgi:hypothetical protein
MALPKLASAKYELTLPSTGEKVEYRPFLVKEEKVLMLAQQSGQQSDILRAVEDIVDACTFEKVNSKKIPFFDLEYIFLQLRSKSIGEKTTVNITCPDDKKTKVKVDINLSDVQCHKEVGHDTNIKITDTIGVVMDYPRVASVAEIDETAGDAETAFAMIKACVRQIYDAENVYDRNDMDEKELDEFIESMSHDQFLKIQEFFNTMPKVKHSVKVKNPNTGVESEVVLEGLNTFF